MKQKDESLQSGKDEMNLVEYPITLLSKRHESEVKTIEFTDTIIGAEGGIIKREWTVTGSDKYGLPLAQDNDVFLALLMIGKESDFSSPTIYFSRYKLLKIMDQETDAGSNYVRVGESFNRLSGVRIYAKNAFWDNKRKCYVTVNIGIFDEYYLCDGKPRKGERDQEMLPLSHVRLNNTLYESIKAGYIKDLDPDIYFTLKSSVTKRLFRYLDKKKYDGKRKYQINLFTLAYTHIGFDKKVYKYSSDIKKKLKPAHEELFRAGFLKSAEYQKTSDGTSEKVIYTFGKKVELAEPESAPLKKGGEITTEPPAQVSDPLLARLLEIGVTRAMAEQILKEHSPGIIQSQVDALPYREAKAPPAALISSIREGWSLPSSYQEALQRKKRDEEERLLQEQKKSQEAELKSRVEDYLSKLSNDEMAELRREAAEMARSEGTALFRDRKLSEHVIRGYIHVIVEKRLKVCVQ